MWYSSSDTYVTAHILIMRALDLSLLRESKKKKSCEMPVQVFPSVAVIVLGISAIGAGTWLVDKYIDPRVRFFLCYLSKSLLNRISLSLLFFARATIPLSCVCF